MTEKLPMVCQVGLEVTILVKDDLTCRKQPAKINHVVFIGHDGSAFLKQIFSTASEDIELHTACAKSFEDFREKFPKDAEIIREWLSEHGISFFGW